MAHPLDGARLKLARAEEHLRALDDETGHYLDTDFYKIVRHEDGKRCVFVFLVQYQPPPRLSALLGDCLHNLRSSLDFLVWELVHANGRTPSSNVSFPIFKTLAGYQQRGAARIAGVHVDAATAIEALQPYHRGQDAARHPLWLLHELSNADKHRALVLTTAHVTDSRIRLLGAGDPIYPKSIASGVLRHGAILAWFPALSDLLRPEMEVEAFGTSFVAIEKSGPWGHEQPVLVLLESILRFIRDRALTTFERFFL